MRLVAPSILAADFLNLGKDVQFVNQSGDIFHLDVMDGTFVPNLSFGVPVIEAIAKEATRPLDVHLMIVNPDKYVEKFAMIGAEMISFHLEAAQDAGKDPSAIIAQIHSYDVKAGLAIDPDVDVKELFPYLKEVDFVLIMSVFAGFGGQKFIPETLDRLRVLKEEIIRQGADTKIEVDGGIGPGNADEVAQAGADILVAGSSVFKAPDRDKAVKLIRGEKE